MVVAVIGGNGQLGQALQKISGNFPEISFKFFSSSEANVLIPEQLDEIFSKIHPDFCINASAYTAVDKAESEPEKAFAINADGAKNLAKVCNHYNATLIHISTDFVFDGTKATAYSETDLTNPLGVYGASKLKGEEFIQAFAKKYFIIRTSWLYSDFGNNFMKTMLRLSNERDSLSIVSDQIGTPTNANDLAKAIITVVKSGSENYGFYNFSNEGIASWFDFAKAIFEKNKVTIELNPIPTTDFPTPAKRPAYSVLDKSKIKNEFGIIIPDWKTSLKLL